MINALLELLINGNYITWWGTYMNIHEDHWFIDYALKFAGHYGLVREV